MTPEDVTGTPSDSASGGQTSSQTGARQRPGPGSIFMAVGAVGWIALAIGFVVDAQRTFHSYLTAYTWTLALALGALCFLCIVNSMDATWPTAVRRLAEGIAATLPLFALLFVPIFVGMSSLYPWLTPEQFRDPHVHEIVMHRRAYLNVPFFLVRWVIVFTTWIVVAVLFRKWSLRQQYGASEILRRRICVAGVASLIPLGLTISVAAFDWLMSLTPTWYSTMYGFYFFAGCMLGGASLVALTGAVIRAKGLLPELQPSHFHALGRVMLTFTAFWGYTAFFQFMLIWIANRPLEGEWFVQREQGAWWGISVALIVGHFAVPFLLLLSYRLKRTPRLLAAVAIWIIAFRYLEAYWLVMPNHSSVSARPSWIDAGAILALGGTAGALAVWLLRGRPLLALGDPALSKALKYEAR